MKRYLLVGIIALAAILRLYHLTVVPPSASLDEVSIGYNARSILLTGRDEYGLRFPWLLRAYDDYRPAMYVYLVIPFVWLLGLTTVAVRIPSVLMSIGVVYVTYRLGRLLGGKLMGFPGLGYVSSFLLAISPWHIYISRLGHEANLGLTLVVLGMYWFFEFILEKRDRFLLLSAVAFGLSFHGYQSQKLIVPILVGVGAFLFGKALFSRFRLLLVAGVVAVIIALPAVIASFSPEGLIRLKGSSAFPPNERKIAYVSIFAKNYLSHFSPAWLFWGRDREAHKAPGMGVLYPWEVAGLVIGFIALWKMKTHREVRLFLLVWIFSAPMASSIATQSPHVMRSLTALPGLQIIEAMGLWYIGKSLKKTHLPWGTAVLAIGIVTGLSSFWQGYFIRFPKEQSDAFQFAIRDAVSYATKYADGFASVEFSHQGALYQSYMFYLYYANVDPVWYLKNGGTKSGGFAETHYIGKYAFGYLPKRAAELKKDTLYFYDLADVPAGANVIMRFANADGTPAIAAVSQR